jgi:arsenate reductase (thioredoxin)
LIKVLFVCIHNSARSQMAEALLKFHGCDNFQVESAGLEPGKLNTLAISAMQEMGIDISQNETKSVFDFLNEGKIYNYIITVCDETASERCPSFPSKGERLHWSFEDPSSLTGNEKLQKTIEIRDQIEAKIKEFTAVLS